MLSRTVVGAGAGGLAGVGLALTLDGLKWYCRDRPGPTVCDYADPLLLSLIFSFWVLVAGVLVHVGSRWGHLPRGWRVAMLGGGLWITLTAPVVWFRTAYLDAVPADGHSLPKVYGHNFMMVASVIMACVAYAAAASFADQARPRSRGEGGVES